MVKVVDGEFYKSLAVLVFTYWGRGVYFPISSPHKNTTNRIAYSLVALKPIGSILVILLDRGMVFNAKAKMEGFGFGLIAFDVLILIQARASLERTEGCTVPCVSDLGVDEEWGLDFSHLCGVQVLAFNCSLIPSIVLCIPA